MSKDGVSADPTGTGIVTGAGSSKGKKVEYTRREIALPVYDEDGIVLRMTQHVLDLSDDDGEVSCGAGVGGDYICLTRRGKDGEKVRATVYMRDILKLWTALDDPEAAAGMPEAKVTE